MSSVDTISADSNKSHKPAFVETFWKFTRPHTIIGSGLSLLSVFLFATPIDLWTKVIFWKKLALAALPSLFMNVYITGLNQITDIDIDSINKPYLPIAAGSLSKQGGIAIILFSLLAVIFSTNIQEWPLLATLIGSFVLGTIYSLPPFRLKRFPLLAAVCIVVVRGILVNFGFFFQAKTQVVGIQGITGLASGLKLFPESAVASLFFGIFGLVIAFMKDVPDVLGDKMHKIKSLSVRFGPAKLFRVAWKLLFALLMATSAGFTGLLFQSNIAVQQFLCRSFVAAGLATMARDIFVRAGKIAPEDPKAVFDFYLHIWNIFYLCYFLLPFAR